MRRYRVTFRLDGPGIGRRLKSTNVAAKYPADAVTLAVRALTAYPAHQRQATASATANGWQTRENGIVHLYASQSAFWRGDVAETWEYEVTMDEASDFDLAGLVRLGQIVAPIPPRP